MVLESFYCFKGSERSAWANFKYIPGKLEFLHWLPSNINRKISTGEKNIQDPLYPSN